MAGRVGIRGLLASLLLCALPAVTGCWRTTAGSATAAPTTAPPSSPEELERLVVTEVPSGLPRLPDDALSPPAGEKWPPDVAAYAGDPSDEREALAGYGFRFGWERFWGTDAARGPVTSVFVYQFESRAGAAAYAHDLAGNDAEHYGGVLREDAPGVPGGCRLIEVPEPADDLPGPAVLAWCGAGVFSVSVTAVAGTPDAAAAEVEALLADQLERLPPS
ncbi:hypothetical protein ACI8AF_13545 [Blastococcus sp. SYSU D00669]